jgi:hypothetical protein
VSPILQINVVGSMYHPRFLTYQGGFGVNFGESHSWKDHEALSDGSLARSDWRLQFLGQHPYSFAFWGNMLESDVDRAFTQNYEVKTYNFGGNFLYRKGKVPFRLVYEHRERETNNGGGLEKSRLEDIVDEYRALAEYSLSEISEGTLNYRFTSEENRGIDYRTQEAYATNTTLFDAAKRRRFWGKVRWYRQTTDTGGEISNASSLGNLEWEHTDRVRSGYSVSFHSNTAKDKRVKTTSGGGFIRHRLYESLTSELNGSMSYEDAWSGTETKYRGSVIEDYTKRLQEWGVLGIVMSPYVELMQFRPEATRGFEPDERHVMQGLQAEELGRLGIDATSIVVRDLAGTTIYVEGVDYRVRQQGGSRTVTYLTRTLGSSIADPEEVRVEYWYDLPGESDILSTGFNAHTSVRLLNTGTFYWDFATSDQRRLSGNPGWELISTTRNELGVEVRRNWMNFRAEYEKERSTLRSFWGHRESISVELPGGRRWSGSFYGSYEYRDFEDPEETLSTISVATWIQARLTRRTFLELEGTYQFTNWSGTAGPSLDEREGWIVKASVNWVYRGLEAELGGRFSRVEDETREDSIGRLFLSLRRRF